jgi:hypothetical protein
MNSVDDWKELGVTSFGDLRILKTTPNPNHKSSTRTAASTGITEAPIATAATAVPYPGLSHGASGLYSQKKTRI